MKMKHGIGALLVAGLLPLTSPAQMPDLRDMAPDWKDVHATVGLRLWQTEWTTWANSSEPNAYVTGGLKRTVIPLVSVRYRNFFVSGSTVLKATFDFPPVTTFNVDFPRQTNVIDPFSFSRKEYDVNLGYFIVPDRLAVSVGWKNIKFSNARYAKEVKGPTVGLSATAPIAAYLSVYGNLAYGIPKVKDTDPQTGQSGLLFRDARGRYLLTEFGVAVPLGHFADALTGATLTAGYRYQRVSVYPNGDPTAIVFANVSTYDLTQGPVIGVSMTF